MDNKECEFKYKCHYSNDDCDIIKDVCVHREKLIQIIQLTDQYNAVVAQNKSLQGELNIYKIMTKNLIMLKAGEYSKYHQTFTKFKIQALQELEAENGLH